MVHLIIYYLLNAAVIEVFVSKVSVTFTIINYTSIFSFLLVITEKGQVERISLFIIIHDVYCMFHLHVSYYTL